MELVRSFGVLALLFLLPAGHVAAQHFVSYWPQYRGADINAVKGVTHLHYAFGEFDESGELQTPQNLSVLRAVRAAGYASGARPGLLLGGWNGGDDRHLTKAMSSSESRSRLALSVAKFLRREQLAAVEIDWEYPDSVRQGEHLQSFLAELRSELEPDDINIGLSVPALGVHADMIPTEVFNYIDVLSVMAYDNIGSTHASREFFQASLDYWVARGAPPKIIAMGIPAYSRPEARTFRQLVVADKRNAWRDSDGIDNWNGIPTVRWKANLASQYGAGLMLWELGQDSPAPTSIALTLANEIVDQ